VPPGPRTRGYTDAMTRRRLDPTALKRATAIACAARRRYDRNERLQGIAPIVALAIGVALSLTIIAALAAAPAIIPWWCSASGSCQ
jgi:hypothetical protein